MTHGAPRARKQGLVKAALHRFLSDPRARSLDPDDPQAAALRVKLLKAKPVMRKIYLELYEEYISVIKASPPGPAVEIGASGGFFREVWPKVITSDLVAVPGLRLVLDAQRLPFKDASIACLLLHDVLHHLPRPADFFSEAQRCLKPGGKIVMIEPAVTPWSGLLYRYLHVEPFDRKADWELAQSGPMSGANVALPWIIFFRDHKLWETRFPGLRLTAARLHTPLSYHLSGGINYRSMLPGCLFGPVRALERLLTPVNGLIATMMTLVVTKRSPRNV